jgi:adenosylhomocysteine nucleosidase
MPDFNNFITKNGKFRIAAFVVFCTFKPWYWPGLLRMGENSRKAAQALRDSLLENLQGPGAVTNRNGYPNLKR